MPLNILPIEQYKVKRGETFTIQLEAEGGSGDHTWSVSSRMGTPTGFPNVTISQKESLVVSEDIVVNAQAGVYIFDVSVRSGADTANAIFSIRVVDYGRDVVTREEEFSQQRARRRLTIEVDVNTELEDGALYEMRGEIAFENLVVHRSQRLDIKLSNDIGSSIEVGRISERTGTYVIPVVRPDQIERLLHSILTCVLTFPTPTLNTAITLTSTEADTTYQWKRGRVNIPTATSASYTPTQEDINDGLTCLLTFPTPVVGEDISLTSSEIDTLYQWKRNNENISIEEMYSPEQADIGAKKLRITLSGEEQLLGGGRQSYLINKFDYSSLRFRVDFVVVDRVRVNPIFDKFSVIGDQYADCKGLWRQEVLRAIGGVGSYTWNVYVDSKNATLLQVSIEDGISVLKPTNVFFDDTNKMDMEEDGIYHVLVQATDTEGNVGIEPFLLDLRDADAGVRIESVNNVSVDRSLVCLLSFSNLTLNTAIALLSSEGDTTYQWKRGVANIATGASYTPTQADIDAGLTCILTFPTPTLNTAIVLTSTATDTTYQWKRGGINIFSETSASYIPVQADMVGRVSFGLPFRVSQGIEFDTGRTGVLPFVWSFRVYKSQESPVERQVFDIGDETKVARLQEDMPTGVAPVRTELIGEEIPFQIHPDTGFISVRSGQEVDPGNYIISVTVQEECQRNDATPHKFDTVDVSFLGSGIWVGSPENNLRTLQISPDDRLGDIPVGIGDGSVVDDRVVRGPYVTGSFLNIDEFSGLPSGVYGTDLYIVDGGGNRIEPRRVEICVVDKTLQLTPIENQQVLKGGYLRVDFQVSGGVYPYSWRMREVDHDGKQFGFQSRLPLFDVSIAEDEGSFEVLIPGALEDAEDSNNDLTLGTVEGEYAIRVEAFDSCGGYDTFVYTLSVRDPQVEVMDIDPETGVEAVRIEGEEDPVFVAYWGEIFHLDSFQAKGGFPPYHWSLLRNTVDVASGGDYDLLDSPYLENLLGKYRSGGEQHRARDFDPNRGDEDGTAFLQSGVAYDTRLYDAIWNQKWETIPEEVMAEAKKATAKTGKHVGRIYDDGRVGLNQPPHDILTNINSRTGEITELIERGDDVFNHNSTFPPPTSYTGNTTVEKDFLNFALNNPHESSNFVFATDRYAIDTPGTTISYEYKLGVPTGRYFQKVWVRDSVWFKIRDRLQKRIESFEGDLNSAGRPYLARSLARLQEITDRLDVIGRIRTIEGKLYLLNGRGDSGPDAADIRVRVKVLYDEGRALSDNAGDPMDATQILALSPMQIQSLPWKRGYLDQDEQALSYDVNRRGYEEEMLKKEKVTLQAFQYLLPGSAEEESAIKDRRKSIEKSIMVIDKRIGQINDPANIEEIYLENQKRTLGEEDDLLENYGSMDVSSFLVGKTQINERRRLQQEIRKHEATFLFIVDVRDPLREEVRTLVERMNEIIKRVGGAPIPLLEEEGKWGLSVKKQIPSFNGSGFGGSSITIDPRPSYAGDVTEFSSDADKELNEIKKGGIPRRLREIDDQIFYVVESEEDDKSVIPPAPYELFEQSPFNETESDRPMKSGEVVLAIEEAQKELEMLAEDAASEERAKLVERIDRLEDLRDELTREREALEEERERLNEERIELEPRLTLAREALAKYEKGGYRGTGV